MYESYVLLKGTHCLTSVKNSLWWIGFQGMDVSRWYSWMTRSQGLRSMAMWSLVACQQRR